MPFTETGKEKAKREAYMKANKERGVRQEQERDYKMFGTTEQNIPKVDTMGNVTGMKKGGKVMSKKAKRYDEGGDVETGTTQGQNARIDDDVRAKALEYANSRIEDEPMIDMRPAPKAKPKSASFKEKAKSTGFTSAETGGGAALMTRKDSSGSKPAPKASPSKKKDTSSIDYSVGNAMKKGGSVKKVAGKLATRGYGKAR